jgi:nitroreductase
MSTPVTDIISKRNSVRSFTEQPVPKELVEEILMVAGKSPSGSNLQPWIVHVVTGEVKEELTRLIGERAMTNPTGEAGGMPIYPKKLLGPWKARRNDCAEVMYKQIGISREDKMARMMQVFKNFSFFDAPVGIIITIDTSLSESQIFDCGIFLQSLMLVAEERGLATCPQFCWSLWQNTVREVLKLDDNEMITAGLSLGYENPDDPINKAAQPRLKSEEFIHFHGF